MFYRESRFELDNFLRLKSKSPVSIFERVPERTVPNAKIKLRTTGFSHSFLSGSVRFQGNRFDFSLCPIESARIAVSNGVFSLQMFRVVLQRVLVADLEGHLEKRRRSQTIKKVNTKTHRTLLYRRDLVPRQFFVVSPTKLCKNNA